MKICLVGHYTERPDEGVRKLAFCLARELARRFEVMTLSISKPFSWGRSRAFSPDIIHYILCPTTAGLAAAKFLSLLCPKAKTIVSAPQPAYLPRGKWMSFLKPNLVLIQSCQSEDMFRSLGYKTRFLPNGVDVEKFVPVTAEKKQELRQKYGIKEGEFIILHIASLKRGRNLEMLKKLQSEGHNQVLIIGRTGEHRDEELGYELEQAGCLVRKEYLPNIEEIYALSDCYVFPTVDRRYCIEMPLSVLEAMSCNLPVVTTPFEALPRAFEEGDGFIFAQQESDFLGAVERVKKGDMLIKTGEKVLPYSWEWVTEELGIIYQDLCRVE